MFFSPVTGIVLKGTVHRHVYRCTFYLKEIYRSIGLYNYHLFHLESQTTNVKGVNWKGFVKNSNSSLFQNKTLYVLVNLIELTF